MTHLLAPALIRVAWRRLLAADAGAVRATAAIDPRDASMGARVHASPAAARRSRWAPLPVWPITTIGGVWFTVVKGGKA